MKGLVGGPLSVGGLGPRPSAPPLKSGPGSADSPRYAKNPSAQRTFYGYRYLLTPSLSAMCMAQTRKYRYTNLDNT